MVDKQLALNWWNNLTTSEQAKMWREYTSYTTILENDEASDFDIVIMYYDTLENELCESTIERNLFGDIIED